MTSHLKSVFFFVLCFTLGLSAFYSRYDETNISRNPAALNNKVFQISSLSSEEIKDQLAAKIKVSPTIDGLKSIHLSGFSSSICKSYSDIEMTFQADGVAVAGEAPTLKLKVPCKPGQDPSELSSIILPVEQMLKEKYRNAEFSFTGVETKITTAHASDAWPKTWILHSVKFVNSEGSHKTSVMNRNIASTGDLIVIEL